MAFSEVRPSVEVLNGLPEGGITKKATEKNSTAQKPKTTAAEPVPKKNEEPVTASTTVQPPKSNIPEPDPVGDFWGPMAIMALAIGAIIVFITKRMKPVTGYAHRHARVGGHSHNTPGKLLPRAMGASHKRRRH